MLLAKCILLINMMHFSLMEVEGEIKCWRTGNERKIRENYSNELKMGALLYSFVLFGLQRTFLVHKFNIMHYAVVAQ